MATHSSTLAWKIPWGRQESDTTEWLHFHALEEEMATHSSVFASRIPGAGEPGGLPSVGSHRVGHDWRVRERGEANMKAKIYKFSIENSIFSCMKLKVRQQTFKNTLLSTPFFSILLAISPSNLHLSIVKSHSVVSNSLWPHGLYSPGNSPGQNTGVVAFSFSRRPSQPRDWAQVSRIAGGFFTSWATREAPFINRTMFM